MRRTCILCGKGTKVGRNRSHAQNRTSRTFMANIHKVSMMIGGEKLGGNFCSKCLKTLKKEVDPRVVKA